MAKKKATAKKPVARKAPAKKPAPKKQAKPGVGKSFKVTTDARGNLTSIRPL